MNFHFIVNHSKKLSLSVPGTFLPINQHYFLQKRAKSSGSNGDQSGSEDTDDDDQIPSVTLEDIRGLRRGCPVPKQGLMCDLLWADPRVKYTKLFVYDDFLGIAVSQWFVK